MSLLTGYCLHDLFDLLDEFFLYFKYKKAMTITYICSGVYFVLCPKQGNKIEGVVLNRVCILGIFLSLTGSGFQIVSSSFSGFFREF